MSVFEARAVTKSFTGQLALKGIDLAIQTGNVYGLAGHNGAGKSTLLRILSGAESPTSGTLLLDGEPVTFGSPRDALAHGVASVYQELRIIGPLTVAENIFLGHERARRLMADRPTMNRLAAEVLAQYGLNIPPDLPVRELSHAQRQFVEIVAALERQATFLLLDEPTSALETGQIEQLLDTLRQVVASRSVAVVLVTHKLPEIFRIAQHVTVLRDGEMVLSRPVSQVTVRDVAALMVGDESEERGDPAPVGAPVESPQSAAAEPHLFEAVNVRTTRLTETSLAVERGSVVGLYGLVGAGRTEFLHAIYGVDRVIGGTMRLDGKPYHPRGPEDAIATGVAYVTEDRRLNGLVPEMDAIANVALPMLRHWARAGVVDRQSLRAAVLGELEAIHLRGDPLQPVKHLSGGNQQKILFARASLQRPALLLLDEPTKGIDVGVKEEIYQIIHAWAHERGITILVASSEEEEILRVSDRIAIFANKRCTTVIPNSSQLTPADLRKLSSLDGVVA
jgi:ABC-type sugar transport system ATPase subunit